MAFQQPHHNNPMANKRKGTALPYHLRPRQPRAHQPNGDESKTPVLTRSQPPRARNDSIRVQRARDEIKVLKESFANSQDVVRQQKAELDDANAALAELRQKEESSNSVRRRRNTELSIAKAAITTLQEKAEVSNSLLRQRNTELADLEEKMEVSDSLLRFARQAVEEKSAEIKKSRTLAEERETVNNELHEQVHDIGMASANDATQMAMTISAKRSLNLLNGYKNDIAERDERLRWYKWEAEVSSTQILEREGKIQACETAVKVAQKQVAQRDEKISGLEKELASARQQAAEARAIADDQQKLIERLL